MAKKRVMGRAPRGSRPNPKTIKNPPHMSRKPRFASQDEAMEYLHDRKIKVSVEIIKLEGLPDVQNKTIDLGSKVPGLKLLGAIDYLRYTHHFHVVHD